MELSDNQAQIRGIDDVNRLSVREGHNYMYWS